MSDKIRLLVTDGASGRFLARVKANAAAEPFDIIAPESADLDALLALAPEAEAILCYKAALPASVIRAAPRLRYIQKHGLNCKNIAVEAARERGIPVGTQSLMRNATVAEQALTLMLCCERKTISGPEGGRGGRLPRDGAGTRRHQPVGHPAQLAGDRGRRGALRQERGGHRPGRHRHGHRGALRGLRHGYLLPPAHAPHAGRRGGVSSDLSGFRRPPRARRLSRARPAPHRRERGDDRGRTARAHEADGDPHQRRKRRARR